jgi:hypothetical protein
MSTLKLEAVKIFEIKAYTLHLHGAIFLEHGSHEDAVISFCIFLPNVWDVVGGLLGVFMLIFRNKNNNDIVL